MHNTVKKKIFFFLYLSLEFYIKMSEKVKITIVLKIFL